MNDKRHLKLPNITRAKMALSKNFLVVNSSWIQTLANRNAVIHFSSYAFNTPFIYLFIYEKMIVYLDDGLAQSSIGSVVTWRYRIPGHINPSITQDINKTINTRFQSVNQTPLFIGLKKNYTNSNLSASLAKHLIDLF